MNPRFSLDKIKYCVDQATFQKAISLYEHRKVTHFEDNEFTYGAVVLGTKPYKVYLTAKKYDEGECECYLGQNDILCKHLIALAIYAIKRGEKLTKEEKEQITHPASSGISKELNSNEEKIIKLQISGALRYIKAYTGPSRIWFAYQDSLVEGCNRLSEIICHLPVGIKSAEIIIDLLLRLDKKLQIGGVDDSDGTVGNFITGTVDVLQEYITINNKTIKTFIKLVRIESCFGWEKPLVDLYKKG